jgi:ribosomal protein S18 acetylase RimI-like enzyme
MITIRLASAQNPHDIHATMHLIHQAIENESEYSDAVTSEEIAHHSYTNIAERVAEGLCLVAVDCKQIVGVCIGEHDCGIIWLNWIAVDPQYQNQNIGRAMLDKFIHNLETTNSRPAKGHKIACTTLISNEASKALMGKMGFYKVAPLFNHWHGLDFYLWENLI